MKMNLTENLWTLAKRYVTAYLENDVTIDLEQMNTNGANQTYVWLLRDCGTTLIREKWLAFENSIDFTLFSHYHPESIRKAYLITVDEVNGQQLIGDVKPILNYLKYYNHKLNQARESDQVEVEVILKDGTKRTLTKTAPDLNVSYYRVLADLNLVESDIQKMRYTDFRFLA